MTETNGESRLATVQLLLPDLREAIGVDPASAAGLFEELHPADGVDLISALEDEEILTLFTNLPPADTATLTAFMEASTAYELLRQLPSELVADILEEMDPDDGAELLAEFEDDEQAQVLSQMEKEDREETEALLAHEEETAGRLMTPHFVTVPIEGTAATAIERARAGAREEWSMHSLYVVDEAQILRGRVTLMEVLAAEPDAKIADLMDTDPPKVYVDTDQEEVARVVSKYDLIAVPVLERSGALAGIITVDDMVDILIEEGTEDAHRLGAVEPLDNPYFSTGFWEMAWKRGMWLCLLFFVTMFTGTVLQHSSDMLTHTLNLILFVPLVIASGGNSGAQSATLVTRALATGEVRVGNAIRVAGREIGMGLSLGFVLATLGFARALLWDTGDRVAWIVAITLICVCTWGALLGSMLPLLLKKAGIDPAIASSPFVASMVDVSGILLYMAVAHAILHVP
ncbi:MAG: magnesium transporter [Candidatus Eisenbacteria bacterium]